MLPGQTPQVTDDNAATASAERSDPDEETLSDDAESVQNLPVEPNSGGSANESPRERGRVLQKRNPIASEYQSFGEVGLGSAADGDGEGVDYRAFFPRSQLVGRPDSLTAGMNWNYNHLSGSSAWGGSLKGVVSLVPGEASVAFQVNSSAADRAVEHYQAYWSNMDDGSGYFLDRPRYSQDLIYTRDNRYSAQLEWAPTANQTFYLRGFYQDYYDRMYRNRLELQFGSGDFEALEYEGDTVTEGVATNAKTRRYFGDTITERQRYRLMAGGETRADWGSISYSVYYHKWDLSDMWWDWNFNDEGIDIQYDATDPAFPTYTVLSGEDFNNTDTAAFTSLRLHPTETSDEDFAGRTDVEYRVDNFAQPIWVYSGLLHRQKERNNGEQRDVYSYVDGSRFTLTDVGLTGDPGLIVRDHFDQPQGLAPTSAANFFYSNPDLFDYQENSSLLESYQQSYTAKEAVTGGYLLLASAWEQWNVSVGLRAERTKTDSTGIVLVPESLNDPEEGTEVDRIIVDPNEPSENTVVKELSADNDYWNYLPSLQVDYELDEQWTFRAAWSQVLMRPQYYDIVQYRRVSYPTRTISEGNPSLEPTRITQYQIGATYETPTWGAFGLELYYLKIKDFFYGAAGTEYLDGKEFSVSRVENGDEGYIQGFTVQWDKQFQLSETWQMVNSFGYTYSDHEAEISTETRPSEKIWVPGRSEHLFQGSISFQDPQTRITLGYAYQSEALDDVGEEAGRDTYRENVISFDASVSRQFGEHWRLGVQAYNLLDSPERSYMGDELRKTNNQYSLWYGVVSAEYSF